MLTINIGGQNRPIHVGTNQGDIFCRLQGLSLNAYIATMTNVDNFGFGVQRDLIFSALQAGAEKQGQVVGFNNLQVGDWMDEPQYDALATLKPITEALTAQFQAKAEYQKQREVKNAAAPTEGASQPATTAVS